MNASKDAVPAAAQSSEEALLAMRRSKAEALRSRGDNPFPNQVAASERSWIGDLRTRFAPALADAAEQRYDAEKFAALQGGERVYVLGRVVARRGFGKLTFLRLRDQTGEIQLFIRKDQLGAEFERLADIDVADHVEARGPVILTKTGELSVDVDGLRLIGKALRPLPEKWHGLTDVELRYRHRYVDLVANPAAAHALRARSIIVQALRDFLDRESFIEVETPTLHQVVGGATAKPFITHHNTLDLQLYLRIAPELYLKRLLVGGFERVYEIGRCYRNEGISTRHNPEFTLLEFYQAYATYITLMDLGERLLRHTDEFLARRFTELGLGAEIEGVRAKRGFTLDEPFVRLPMLEALAAALAKAGVREPLIERLRDGGPWSPEAFKADALRWRGQGERARAIDWPNLGKALAKCSKAGERIFVAYEYIAEPFLTEDYRSRSGTHSVPVFITDHPTDVSPLARRRDDDPSVTERFELFADGRELGNAFSELNDPDDQAERFREQVARKDAGNEEAMDYDADYIRALEHGMPPAAGFGIGVDRLTMMLTGQESIRDVIAFPLLRPEASRG
ncbi:MAG TPA: lysine--tRNA ligase [Polyangiaceae bacterium]|nr:lysine--tRNA ligase [Polyangiaceae bacterium]